MRVGTLAQAGQELSAEAGTIGRGDVALGDLRQFRDELLVPAGVVGRTVSWMRAQLPQERLGVEGPLQSSRQSGE